MWEVIKLLLAYEGCIQISENIERHECWKQAREYSDKVGKPLLVIGMKKIFWQPPNGDITIDIDPCVNDISGGVCADECNIPFADKTFGAVYNAHTLEHLKTPDNAIQAIRECQRVADKVFLLYPNPYSIISNIHPEHNLRLKLDKSDIIVTSLKTKEIARFNIG